MTQLTVRSVDERLHAALKQEAQRRGQSLNRCVLELLREALNMGASPQNREYDDLDHLAGTWSKAEAAEFDAHLQRQRQIDEKLWS